MATNRSAIDLTVATYNVLHAYHRKQIEENIRTLINGGVDVLCIQEAELPIEKLVPAHWGLRYFLAEGRGCFLAITWDASKLTLQESKEIILPSLSRPGFTQKLTGYRAENIQRGALVAWFQLGDKSIQVINAHLAWEGGTRHRLDQLRFLLKNTHAISCDARVLMGDFNTFIPAALRRIQERKIEETLGKAWINVLPDLPWSCDVSHTDPQDGFEVFRVILQTLHLKMRSRLDYIFAQNINVGHAKMLDLPGSDHRPLIATLRV